jgi:hypothetical protein
MVSVVTVYDLGGGAHTAYCIDSIWQMCARMSMVDSLKGGGGFRLTNGDTYLGGKDLDIVLVEHTSGPGLQQPTKNCCVPSLSSLFLSSSGQLIPVRRFWVVWVSSHLTSMRRAPQCLTELESVQRGVQDEVPGASSRAAPQRAVDVKLPRG